MEIELIHLKKSFPDITPIKDFSATVHDGDVISIIGPSGVGKSALLRAIIMLSPPTEGKIVFNGVDITAPKCNLNEVRKKIGMVFQNFNLFTHLTVLENVMLGLRELLHYSKQKAYDVAMENLDLVGLTDKALSYPEDLSGGQKQRVAIARTVAMDPEIILFDEPTSALDPAMAREVETVICKLARAGKTMMIVTNEMRFAKAVSNRIFYLDHGVLYEEGTPEEIFNNPKRERTKAFIKQLCVLKFKSNTGDFNFAAFLTQYARFAGNNGIPMDITAKVQYGVSDFCEKFISKYVFKVLPLDLIVEYHKESASMRIMLFLALLKDKKEEMLAEVKQAFAFCSSFQVSDIEDKDYDCKIEMNV